MALQDLIRVVLPKDDRFFDFLESQAQLAHESAVSLAAILDGDVPKVREAVHTIEKKADGVAHELEDALAKTFVTPIDREDIHKLSVMLDDIADRAYATASAFDMFSVSSPSEATSKQIQLLVEATKDLAALLPSLRSHDWETIRAGARNMKRHEKTGDEIYRAAMRALFAQADIDARTLIREKEIIELLEDAIDMCEDVAEYLANLAVKHG